LHRYRDFHNEKYDRKMVERFCRAVEYEAELILSSFGREPLDIASIYIGGGAPSSADLNMLERWLDSIHGYGRFLPGYEFTIEACPESLTDEFARRTFELGINRIAIGVQSFHMSCLRRLARRRQTKDIYRAFYNARMAGYENIAADLTYALPNQKVKHVRTDIERLTALEPTHISFYRLTTENGLPLKDDIETGEITLPGRDDAAAMYRIGSHMLIDTGYNRYEVSNFARDGWHSRHNYACWRHMPYVGLGPTAHGFVNNFRYGNISDIRNYIEAVATGIMPSAFVEELTEEQRLIETVALSLRTADGIDKEQLILRFGEKALSLIEGKTAVRLIDSGHLLNESGFLRLTDAGFLTADRIIANLVG
jgi:oxygen-independent coproporphyrinogen-3 oxidase